jgi:predicted nucleic acid-binding protein
MRGSVSAKEFVRAMLRAHVIPLDTDLSISAVDIGRQYKLAMADSIIYATAKQYNAALWTTDKHFDGLPNVRYFDKTPCN